MGASIDPYRRYRPILLGIHVSGIDASLSAITICRVACAVSIHPLEAPSG